ncbi:MAG TPA: site-2 protease family protein [Gemmatimonadales bacterium]|nr:site-2 protease family protein [Gemmatimonadales bacterium]
MRWSYTIGRFGGTEVKVHVTFLLLLAWFGYTAYRESGAAAAVTDTLFLVVFFLCVLLHEFGHITMARRFGVRTPDVILLPIGGVARLERIPDEPRQELLIALAGPAVTFAIVVALFALSLASGQGLVLRDPFVPDMPFVVRLLISNVFVLAFNLLPAFPLDGGRVLRALLARRLGLARATRIAGVVGQIFAVALGILGVVADAPLTMLVAFFIFLGAGSEASAVATRVAGQGLRVSQMMVTQFQTIPVHATLSQAVDLLLAGEQREFPVVDNLGRTEGILTRDNLIRGLSRSGPNAVVADAMTSAAPPVSPTLGFHEALDRLRSSGLPALPVVDAGGVLVGMLTMDNITDLLLVRRARG